VLLDSRSGSRKCVPWLHDSFGLQLLVQSAETVRSRLRSAGFKSRRLNLALAKKRRDEPRLRLLFACRVYFSWPLNFLPACILPLSGISVQGGGLLDSLPQRRRMREFGNIRDASKFVRGVSIACELNGTGDTRTTVQYLLLFVLCFQLLFFVMCLYLSAPSRGNVSKLCMDQRR